MGIGGKFLGGFLGLLGGGPLGAVVGAAVGHVFIDSKPQVSNARLEHSRMVQLAYFTALFSMLAKLAKVDGVIDKREAALVTEFIRTAGFDAETRAFAKKVFNEAKHQSATFEDFAKDFHRLTTGQTTLHNTILAMLCQVAAADGVLHPSEKICLQNAAIIFRIHSRDFDAIMAQFFGVNGSCGSLESCYKILNCNSGSSVAEIKSSYKKLVKEFHPDILQSKGLPDELMTQAAERFREVQDAYEKVKKNRSF